MIQNKHLIFGSTAVAYWFPDLKREPKDYDIIINEIKRNTKRCEYHWVPGFQYILDNNVDSYYVDPDFLYTTKVSHAAWDIHWDKTMYDIKFLQDKGCKLDYKLYRILLKEWEIKHGSKNIILKGTPEEFFKITITRTVPHDELHHLVKFYDRPLHDLLRPNPNDVGFSKSLWIALSYEDQLKCALEEVYVFALERYVHYPPNIAFIKALKQLITKSTTGYFNLFLIENFFKLLYYDREHYNKYYKQYKGDINVN